MRHPLHFASAPRGGYSAAMAKREAAAERRAVRGSSTGFVRLDEATGLGLGFALVGVALAIGPLAELWLPQLLDHVRASIRGELSPSAALVGLLGPLISSGAALAALATWQGGRVRSPRPSEQASRHHQGSAGDDAPAWASSTKAVAAGLVVLVLCVQSARIWVFSVHAAAADLGPLMAALAHALGGLCGGLGFALVATHVLAQLDAGGRAGAARRPAD